jgi:hypothetical protein
MGSIGRAVGRYLSEPVKNYRPLTTSAPSMLASALRPADVLLVEGNTRVSSGIKYLTQSTWSHAALYVGDALAGGTDAGEVPVLLEVDMVEGVWVVPLSKYTGGDETFEPFPTLMSFIQGALRPHSPQWQ